jgi:hypothetical protein
MLDEDMGAGGRAVARSFRRGLSFEPVELVDARPARRLEVEDEYLKTTR